MELPEFFRVIVKNVHQAPIGCIVAVTGKNPNPDYKTVGYVTSHTPFGQGVNMGLPNESLTKASPEEVLSAIELEDHPHQRTPYVDSKTKRQQTEFLINNLK